MIPLKDDIPARRFPLVTVVAVLVAVTGFVLAGVWAALVAALFLWLFGQSVEDAMGYGRFALFIALGAGAAALLEPEAAAPGAAAAVLAGYAVLYPRAHVVALSLVPGWMTVLQVPALAVLPLWLPLQALAGGLDPAPLLGAVAGLLTVRLLARNAQADYQRAPAY